MNLISSWNLSKGSTLVVEEIPYLKSAAIGVYIKVGSRHERPNIAGASHFIEHMLFKGTPRRTAREIAEGFEKIGGQLNAFTSKEYTCIYARTLDEDIYIAMDIIFDMLFNSGFVSKDFNTEKEVIIEEINIYEDTPDDLIHDVFSRNLWKGHAMGSPILGTLDSVGSFDRQEIHDYYKACYVPANMVIALAGNIDKEKIKESIESYLESENKGEVNLPQVKPSGMESFVSMVEKDTEQVQLCIGVPGISYYNPERYTQNVMNSILGGGMSSRLFQSIREERGLAYSVYSFPANYSDTGAYSVCIGTGPTKVSTFFEALFKELDKFTRQGVSDEEVARTQQLIKSSMYLGLESVMNRMSRLGKSLLMYGELKSVEDVITDILAVNAGMVQDFASELLKKPNFSLAAIGPAEVLTEVEKEYRKWWG
ncbi:MAG: pitrilysin family protein [Syntrophomonadaceae bacterium]|nr:pitrilysin family protein [Syntrophomonadaceae bacterium]